MPQLVLSIEGVEIRRVNLQKQRTTLGRKPHNDIVLADLVVSGEHCAFILEGSPTSRSRTSGAPTGPT
jgi:pSer/pThr/pTyr-binding forkhead associated (FHA) protein